MRDTKHKSDIRRLVVNIVEFVDDHQPGRVACTLIDARGTQHRFVDKVPIFTSEHLDKKNTYPRSGLVRCTVLDEWLDSGNELVRVSTAIPDDVESTSGISEFVVFAQQLS